jgi:hypothetical protein
VRAKKWPPLAVVVVVVGTQWKNDELSLARRNPRALTPICYTFVRRGPPRQRTREPNSVSLRVGRSDNQAGALIIKEASLVISALSLSFASMTHKSFFPLYLQRQKRRRQKQIASFLSASLLF